MCRRMISESRAGSLPVDAAMAAISESRLSGSAMRTPGSLRGLGTRAAGPAEHDELSVLLSTIGQAVSRLTGQSYLRSPAPVWLLATGQSPQDGPPVCVQEPLVIRPLPWSTV